MLAGEKNTSQTYNEKNAAKMVIVFKYSLKSPVVIL
jgi:hypothetical protein